MVPTLILMADSMGIPDEQRPDRIFDTEVDHLPARLMAQIADTPFSTAALFVLGSLQLLPAARILLAASLFLGDFAKLLIALPFEGADAAPGDDQGCARIRGESSQMDFA